MHIAEALRVQLDVQRRLHEQLDVLLPDRDTSMACNWSSDLHLQFAGHTVLFILVCFSLQTQRRLQVRIEEQGRRLQKMFDDQLKASGNHAPGSPDGSGDVVGCPSRKHEEADRDELQLTSAATETSSRR
jgi:hypothetical protein